MTVTIHVNGTSNSLVHKGSMGIVKSTIPDVCKTPSPTGPIPIPYPVIISMSANLTKGSTTVKADGKMAAIKGSEISMCNGDEPGTAGGVKSSTFMKETSWILYSFDVKMDGKNACRLSDKLQMNHGNSACLSGVMQKPVGLSPADDQLWDDCTAKHDQYKATQGESAALGGQRFRQLRGKVRGRGAMSTSEMVELENILDQRIEITKRLHKERKEYIDMGCDKFDWTNNGTTEAQRRAAHEGELSNVADEIKGYYETRTRSHGSRA